MLQNWWRRLVKQKSKADRHGRHASPRRKRSRPLALEYLEDRVVPATLRLNTIGPLTGLLDYVSSASVANNLTIDYDSSSNRYTFSDPAETITLLGPLVAPAGSGTNTVSFSAAGINGIEAYLGGGNDTLRVRGLIDNLEAYGEAGGDTFIVGSADNNLNAIHATIIVNGGPIEATTDTLHVNDQGYSGAENYEITSSTVRLPLATTLGSLGTIISSYSNLDQLVLNTGAGVNIIDVLSTATGTATTVNAGGGIDTINVLSTAASSPVTVNAGAGNDTINVRGNSSPVTANGQGGSDTINVGSVSNNLGLIRAAVAVNGGPPDLFPPPDPPFDPPPTDILNVNDQGFGGTETYNITSSTVSLPLSTALGTLGTIISSYSSLSQLVLNTGAGANTINVLSTSGIPVTVNAGAGTDTLAGPNTANTWNLTSPNGGTLNGTAVTFSAVESLTGGSSTDAFVFTSSLTVGQGVSGHINGGAGIDTLNYAAYPPPAVVNLAAGTATGVGGGISNIELLIPPTTPPPSWYRILDNHAPATPGFSVTPGWAYLDNTTFGSFQGVQGDVHYVAAGTGSEIATWTFTGLTAGTYRISATWSEHANRATNAPFSVYNGSPIPANLLFTVLINQELVPNDFLDAGVGWEYVGGPYTITGSTLTVRLTNAANEYVIADAIRIERVGFAGKTLDNHAPATPGFSVTPGWAYLDNTTFGSFQGVQGDVHYVAAGTGSEIATWTFTGLTAGTYRVSATWSEHANRATNAPFRVYNGPATGLPMATVLLNQELAPNDFLDGGFMWEDLGTFTITGSTLTVTLANDANEYVIADAIRIERLS